MKKVLLTTGLSLAVLAGGAFAAQQSGISVAKAATATPAAVTQQALPDQVDAAEAPGTEVNDATEAAGTEVNDATEAAGTEVNDAAEAKGTEAADKEVDPAVEQAQLQAQAKITAEESKATALKKISGTVQSVTLEDEDNTAVYNVAVKDSAGKIQEVKVNAQTGVVVKVDAADGENQDNEGPDSETADDGK
jgi:uncharacterized membrane protein YkoI